MGQAKLRANAVDAGRPLPGPKRCPVKKCRSISIKRHEADSRLALLVANAWGNRMTCPIDQCLDCQAFWEPWPDDDPGDLYRDDVTRPACDNCAYNAGSRESMDPDKRSELKAIASTAADACEDFLSVPWFVCHKGIPIKLSKGGIEFDYEATGQSVGSKGMRQVCVGFLRTMHAQRRKGTSRSQQNC